MHIRKKNKIRRTINAEKNKILNKKCTEINTYIRGNTEVWKFINNTTTEEGKTTPIPTILHKKRMDHYKNSLLEKKPGYEVNYKFK
jgi:hypothetical protein